MKNLAQNETERTKSKRRFVASLPGEAAIYTCGGVEASLRPAAAVDVRSRSRRGKTTGGTGNQPRADASKVGRDASPRCLRTARRAFSTSSCKIRSLHFNGLQQFRYVGPGDQLVWPSRIPLVISAASGRHARKFRKRIRNSLISMIVSDIFTTLREGKRWLADLEGRSMRHQKLRFPCSHCRCAPLAMALLLIYGVWSARGDGVDDLVRNEMRRHPIPGLALEVVKNGKPAKIAGYGAANLEWHTPVTPETVFEIGSVTKQFTAAGILLLAQEGKLSVDDKISRHLKDTTASWGNITLRHLLTHTSGLKNYTGLDGFEMTRHLTQAQFISRMGREPLDFKPGEKWSYCNSGFNLLGYVIENVSGQGYWQFMHERIFGPLGMDSTTNRDARTIIALRASGYETNRAGQFVNRDSDLTDVFSAGAIVSTVGDLAKWNAALDARKLLSAATEQEMWTPVRLNDSSTHAYGFGWFLEPLQGHQNIGHSGSTSGFSASLQRFPKDGLVVIVLTNSDETGVATKLAKEIALMYLTR